MIPDNMPILHVCAAGLDVHKHQTTVSIRRWENAGAVYETDCFNARPSGLGRMVDWLQSHAVDAALMEGTGIYWRAPFEALEQAGIAVSLVNAHQVKQLNPSSPLH